MGGFIVEQPLPHQEINTIDPFLLIHHASKKYTAGSNIKDLGVGPHPHRGFSPVTFVFQGEVHHRDSRGNSSAIRAGGTQWMHSGMGIIHSERPSKAMADHGGTMEIIQFWVNVPASAKMLQPEYMPLSVENTPTLKLDDNISEVQVIAGDFESLSGPVNTHSPLLILRLDLRKGVSKEISIPKEYNALIYQLDGQLQFNKSIDGTIKQLSWFEIGGEGILIEAKQDTRAILLAGLPIEEKVVSQGPFVMNSESEIMEAMRDYQLGKMGFLVEDFEEK